MTSRIPADKLSVYLDAGWPFLWLPQEILPQELKDPYLALGWAPEEGEESSGYWIACPRKQSTFDRFMDLCGLDGKAIQNLDRVPWVEEPNITATTKEWMAPDTVYNLFDQVVRTSRKYDLLRGLSPEDKKQAAFIKAGEYALELTPQLAHIGYASASVLIRMQGGTKLRDGRVAWISRAGSDLKWLGGYDFRITIMDTVWQMLSPSMRIALMDHELCHFERNTTGSWKGRGHDYEEFHAIEARHGAWRNDFTARLETIEAELNSGS